MDRKYQKETKRFEVRDGSGRSFTIIEFTEFTEVSTRGGTQTVEGMKTFKTTDGQRVNRIAKGKYQLTMLQLDLHSQDEGAP